MNLCSNLILFRIYSFVLAYIGVNKQSCSFYYSYISPN